jgi:hypothetical protein
MVTATSHPPLDPSAPPPIMAIRLAALAKVASPFCAERRRDEAAADCRSALKMDPNKQTAEEKVRRPGAAP